MNCYSQFTALFIPAATHDRVGHIIKVRGHLVNLLVIEYIL